MRVPVSSLAFLVCLAAAARAEAPDPIRDDEVAKLIQEQQSAFASIQEKRGKPEELLALYQREAQRDGPPRERAKRFYLLGRAFQLLERGREAQREYQRALEAYPHFPRVHCSLATLAAGVRDLAEAAAQARRALAIDPEYAPAVFALGQYAREAKDFPAALAYFDRVIHMESADDALVRQSFLLKADVRMAQARETLTPQKRDALVDEAVLYATQAGRMDPKQADAYIVKFFAQEVGQRVAESVETLELALRTAEMSLEFRLQILDLLEDRYMRLSFANPSVYVPKVVSALERKLALPLAAEQKATLTRRLEQVRARGQEAFAVWRVEEAIETVQNPGRPDDQRLTALDRLIDILLSDFGLADATFGSVRQQVFQTLVKLIHDGPPALIARVFEFLRHHRPDPLLLPILVHFVYPLTTDRRTPAVRIEAVRTIVEAGQIAGFPILLRSLLDDDPSVLREVDKALSSVTEQRSPIEPGTAPLTEEEVTRVRGFWQKYALGEEGARKLAAGFEALRKSTVHLRRKAHAQRTAPLADVAAFFALDRGLPFPAWHAAATFLEDYLGQPLRPRELRGKPVGEAEREAVTRAIDEWWRGKQEGPAEGEAG